MVHDAVDLTTHLPPNGTLAGDGWESTALEDAGDRRGIEFTPTDLMGPVLRVEQHDTTEWTLVIETPGGANLGTTTYTQAPPALLDADHEAARIDASIGRPSVADSDAQGGDA